MSNKISVVIDITVDRANRALTSFRESISSADGAIGKFKAGAASLGASLKANAVPMAAAAGAAFTVFAKQAIDAASDLEESMNAVDVTFGDAADAIHELGKTSADSFGLSTAAFNTAAVQFSAFAKQVAGPGGDVVGTLDDLMQRAVDFASVMNLDVADAMAVFQSTLAGETEPIRKFGKDVSAAAVEQYALANGLIKSKSEMTESIKVQARYGLLMEQTNDVAGDFADTSDSLANQQRILDANIENLSATVGKHLVPALAAAADNANDMLGVLEDLGLIDLAFKFQEVTNPVKGFGRAMSVAQGETDLFGRSVKHVTDEQLAMLDAFKAAGMTTDDWKDAVDGGHESLESYRHSIQAATGDTEDHTVALDAAGQAYIDNARGMQRESQRTADKLTADWNRILGKIDEEQAFLNAKNEFQNLRDAAVTAWEEGEAGVDGYRQAQLAAQASLSAYILEVGNIPPQKATEINALIDRGKYDEAERLLAALATPRSVWYGVNTYNPSTSANNRYRAAGGSVTAGESYVVGERGPEMFTPNVNGGITSNGAGGGTAVYLTVNAGMGADGTQVGRQIVDALNAYYRNGGRPPG